MNISHKTRSALCQTIRHYCERVLRRDAYQVEDPEISEEMGQNGWTGLGLVTSILQASQSPITSQWIRLQLTNFPAEQACEKNRVLQCGSEWLLSSLSYWKHKEFAPKFPIGTWSSSQRKSHNIVGPTLVTGSSQSLKLSKLSTLSFQQLISFCSGITTPCTCLSLQWQKLSLCSPPLFNPGRR